MKKQFLILLFSFLLLTKYSFGENLTKDNLLKMSPSQIIILANNGDALAQLWLGDAIYNGSIPNWRNFSACEWYYKSAKQNNAEAALKLYKYYLNFRVDSKDCPKIIGIEKPNLDKNYWLLKAARLNNPEAQLILFDDEISSEDNDLIGGQITIGDVIDVLNKFGTPPELYPMMFSAKPSEMYILSQSELSDLGLQGQRTVASKRIEQKKVNLGQSSVETAALGFVKIAMDLASGTGSNKLSSVVNLYAEYVDYYGNSWSQNQILEDKKSFFKRWPVRNYKMDLTRSKAVCTQNNYCLVTGLIVWSATSPERNKNASGEARFEYSLTYLNDEFRITKESSRVVKRNK